VCGAVDWTRCCGGLDWVSHDLSELDGERAEVGDDGLGVCGGLDCVCSGLEWLCGMVDWTRCCGGLDWVRHDLSELDGERAEVGDDGLGEWWTELRVWLTGLGVWCGGLD